MQSNNGIQYEDGFYKWRNFQFTQVVLENPFLEPISDPKSTLDEQPNKAENLFEKEDDYDETTSYDDRLEITDEWREKIVSVHNTLRARKRQRRKQNAKDEIHEEIAKLESELDHSFQQALERLENQTQDDATWLEAWKSMKTSFRPRLDKEESVKLKCCIFRSDNNNKEWMTQLPNYHYRYSFWLPMTSYLFLIFEGTFHISPRDKLRFYSRSSA